MARSKSDTDTVTEAAALRRELEAERAARASTETRLAAEVSRRRTAEMANMSAQERSLVSEQESNSARLEGLENEIQSYEDQIAQLSDEPGHGKDIAALTRKMAAASSKLETESNRKTWLDGQREAFKTKKEESSKTVDRDPSDPVLPNGQAISQFPTETQTWLRAHPQAMTDTAYWNRVVAAAQVAISKGTRDNSPEYFEAIEDSLGLRQAEEEQEDGGEEIVVDPPAKEAYEPEKPQHRAAGPGSMRELPAQRRIPQGSNIQGARRTLPNLSQEEKEAALEIYSREPGLSDADKLKRYAENKAFMQSRQPGHFSGRAN